MYHIFLPSQKPALFIGKHWSMLLRTDCAHWLLSPNRCPSTIQSAKSLWSFLGGALNSVIKVLCLRSFVQLVACLGYHTVSPVWSKALQPTSILFSTVRTAHVGQWIPDLPFCFCLLKFNSTIQLCSQVFFCRHMVYNQLRKESSHIWFISIFFSGH